jgi:hypothetical protein
MGHLLAQTRTWDGKHEEAPLFVPTEETYWPRSGLITSQTLKNRGYIEV